MTAPAISLVVPAIRRVTQAYPGIEINIQVETSNVLARELLAARHDFIISRIPDELNPRLFAAHEIGVEKACLIVRNGHPLLEKGVVGLQDLHRPRLGVPAAGHAAAPHGRGHLHLAPACRCRKISSTPRRCS